MTEPDTSSRVQCLTDLRYRLLRDGAPGAQLEADAELLLGCIQTETRIADAGGTFAVVNVMNDRNEGLVDVTWGDVPRQLDVNKARECAWMLMECAAVAEAEAMFLRFLAAAGLPGELGVAMLAAFRAYRDAEVAERNAAAATDPTP